MPFTELLRSRITSSELPPETRVDVLTVQRIRRGSNHTFGEPITIGEKDNHNREKEKEVKGSKVRRILQSAIRNK